MRVSTIKRIFLSRISRSALLVATAGCALLFAALPEGQAHRGATGVVKARMDDMGALKSEMKVLSAFVRRPETFDATRTRRAVATLNTVAARMEHRFPKGSLQPPSEAKPEIWQDWPAFEREIAKFASATETLGQATSFAAFQAAFVDVGASCRSCHKAFKQDD